MNWARRVNISYSADPKNPKIFWLLKIAFYSSPLKRNCTSRLGNTGTSCVASCKKLQEIWKALEYHLKNAIKQDWALNLTSEIIVGSNVNGGQALKKGSYFVFQRMTFFPCVLKFVSNIMSTLQFWLQFQFQQLILVMHSRWLHRNFWKCLFIVSATARKRCGKMTSIWWWKRISVEYLTRS